DPRIRVLAPEQVETLPDRSIDLIVANSVAQHLTAAELDHLLRLWHRLLAPGGTLVGGDVIPPDAGALTDAIALVRYAVRNGFLVAALWGLVRTAASPYRKLRTRLGIARYTQPEFMAKLRAT